MTIRTFSSREFTRDVSAAKRAAIEGPVFITDRGKPRFVLLTIENYFAQSGAQEPSFLEMMDSIDGGGDDIDFEVPRLSMTLRPVHLEDGEI
ncbi:hypothetical protein SAMN02745117_01404 [Lampropedia hyalina DSM 16112]|uniref:Antitoxin n=1 Tax=Lampropedia hyalina DSM 16112 TaxID=1122156 RepID=A0A1M4Z749_9BURK|nr:hypothetical protein [Lampropedia hyalina]SHF13840.1 hypothetical protein SAMN02745117_01404 [Lampropedia hyalina DSM 16112]